MKFCKTSALDLVLEEEREEEEVEEEQAYQLNWVARLWRLYWVACGWADRSLRVLYAGRVAGLGEALLGAAAETARWRLRTWDDLTQEEAVALLMAAHPDGTAAFATDVAVAEMLAQYLPAPGQTLRDRPLSDGLQDVQMDRYVGSGRLELKVSWPNLDIDEVLGLRQSAYRGVDGHSEEGDHGAEVRHIMALEANI